MSGLGSWVEVDGWFMATQKGLIWSSWSAWTAYVSPSVEVVDMNYRRTIQCTSAYAHLSIRRECRAKIGGIGGYVYLNTFKPSHHNATSCTIRQGKQLVAQS